MFERVLVANRGEIAVRIARTCRRLGIATVAVYSDPDARARHVAAADDAVHLPGEAPAATYMNVDAVVAAALSSGAEAVHPGYGFLSEKAELARAVAAAGLAWIGPPPGVLDAVGDKVNARALAAAAGVPVVPGLMTAAAGPGEVADLARTAGYPVALKAAAGGGGRGFRVARSGDELRAAFDAARREAIAYFGSGDLYAEAYLEAPKHLEVQILSPRPGEALWLGVRDCSLQRRHQKLVEETPAARATPAAEDLGSAATAIAKQCGYVGAGTVEMLATAEGAFYFLEVNARLQVEHTVTEEVYGVDLVECQLRIAAGEPLGFGQHDLEARGHAIECRINAEDPALGFAPSPGALVRYREPAGSGVRVDSGYGEGDDIPAAYDSLIAKLVVSGRDRDRARARMAAALAGFEIGGVATTIAFHRLLVEDPEFVAGTHTTATVDRVAGAVAGSAPAVRLTVAGTPVSLWHPAMAPSARRGRSPRRSGEVTAPMQGTVVDVLVRPGDRVAAGQPVAVLETMKMETTVPAPAAGTVVEVRARPGRPAAAGEVLAVVS